MKNEKNMQDIKTVNLSKLKLKIKIYRGLLESVIDIKSGKELFIMPLEDDNQDTDEYMAELPLYARKCSKCGKVFNEGFCIGGGMEYYCSDECLYSVMSKEDYLKLYDNGNSDTYWTQWEDLDDMFFYEDGSEIDEGME